MPTVIHKSRLTITEGRRETTRAVEWKARPSLWSPPIDLYETPDRYVVRMEIAGMREEEFEVIVEDNILFISGSRPDIAERRAFHQMEIRFGKFATAIAIPGPVEVDDARAEYKDGFLNIVFPKAKHNQIKVE